MNKIPKSFKIFGHEYKVEFHSDLFVKECTYGDYDPDLKLIRLQLPCKLYKKNESIDMEGVSTTQNIEFEMNEDVLMETWYHELTHCILDATNQHKIFDDEILVGNFGEALHQIFKHIQTTNDLIYDDGKK